MVHLASYNFLTYSFSSLPSNRASPGVDLGLGMLVQVRLRANLERFHLAASVAANPPMLMCVFDSSGAVKSWFMLDSLLHKNWRCPSAHAIEQESGEDVDVCFKR